jgi:hypothetical protein
MDQMLKLAVTAVVVLLLTLLLSAPLVSGGETKTWVLDDFEDGNLKAASGLSWFLLADDLMGGATEARLQVRKGGSSGSRHALGLSGRLAAGKRSFAGAWTSLDPTGRSVDLSTFEGIRLRVRTQRRLQVGLRGSFINYMADVEPGAGWRQVDIPFARLAPLGKVPEGTRLNPGKIENLGITTPQLPSAEDRPAEDFAVEVDDIVLYGPGQGSAAPKALETPGTTYVLPFTPQAEIPSKGWVDLATDPAGDGRQPSLPDATRLEVIPATADGLLWLRVTLREPPHGRWMGVNAVLDVDGDPANGKPWWGANSTFKFDRIVSVWCMNVGDGCEGMIGVADADQATTGVLSDDNGSAGIRIAIDKERRAFIVGVPRDVLHLKADPARMLVAVGSALSFNDDVPGDGAATLR